MLVDELAELSRMLTSECGPFLADSALTRDMWVRSDYEGWVLNLLLSSVGGVLLRFLSQHECFHSVDRDDGWRTHVWYDPANSPEYATFKGRTLAESVGKAILGLARLQRGQIETFSQLAEPVEK